MDSLPVRTLPGLTWPAIPRGDVSQLWGLCLELNQTQWLSPEEIVAGQLAQARALLSHCRQHVPYYQELLGKCAIKPEEVRSLDDFRCLPILRRRVFQEQFPRFQATSLPPGIVKSGKAKTSGTGGVPITVLQTNLVALWWFACLLRDLEWSAIDPRGSLASIRNLGVGSADPEQAKQGVVMPHWHSDLVGLLHTGPSYGMDIQQSPAQQLQWLLRIQPNYLLSTPSNVVLLAGLLQASGQKLTRLRAIQVIAESLNAEDQSRIEGAFGVPVKNLYSCMEAGYVASSCPEGHGLHVHAENVLLEVVDEEDRPCAPGQTGRVLLTALRNHLTPFVRYEILDEVTMGPARCPCGRGLPLLTQVQGKVRPILPLPGGRFKASHQLVHLLFKLNLYHQHQIVQRGLDDFLVRLVPNRNWTADSPARIATCIQQYLETPVRVQVELVERIATTAAGKARDVVVECPAAPEQA